MKDREELYQKVSPPGDPIPINLEPFDINDETPEDIEIRAVIKGMKMAELEEPQGE